MKTLSAETTQHITPKEGWILPQANAFALPEKVLQFGTGVLLRGLQDYYIDKANHQGIFNGRVVVIKSTAMGGTEDFDRQNGVFTHCIRGINNGQPVYENRINTSISRVLTASTQWDEILQCAENPHMQVVISNTTEVGISLNEEDRITDAPPASYPGKLLAFLYHRYQFFKADPSKGMVIIPCELIPDNGTKLKNIVLKLAALNNLEPECVAWLEQANHFCNSLVDRIVPGKLPAEEKAQVESQMDLCDELMVMSEVYTLWAIESQQPEKIAAILSFAQADTGIVITDDIGKFRELKLRMLNGTHTLSCGLAVVAGFDTVKQAMEDEAMTTYIEQLMLNEIAPAIPYTISRLDAEVFAAGVIDRFRNPALDHQWLAITMQFSSKLKMRTQPLLHNHYKNNQTVPQLIALGYAAHILFMRCTEENGSYWGVLNGKKYQIKDDQANMYYQKSLHHQGASLVHAVLTDQQLWGEDLTAYPGFADAVVAYYHGLSSANPISIIKDAVTTTA